MEGHSTGRIAIEGPAVYKIILRWITAYDQGLRSNQWSADHGWDRKSDCL